MKINSKNKKNAIVPAKRGRGRPRKNAVEIPAKKQAKPKKTLKSKENSAKAESPAKTLKLEAKQIFGEARKPMSLLKKLSKEYAKILTSALKLGDDKTVAQIVKLFGYLGYEYADGKVTVTVSGKVKTPMAKQPVETPETAPEVEELDDTDVVEVAEDGDAPDVFASDDSVRPAETPEVVVDVDTAEKLANGEISEDEIKTDSDPISEEDEDLIVNGDDRPSDIDDEQAEYRRDFFGEVADNGDDY